MNGLMTLHNMTKPPVQPITPRMQMVWEVLEAAKDVRDATVMAACRRLIVANRRGWRKHARAADIALIQEFADLAA
jgi:hypothetical protein